MGLAPLQIVPDPRGEPRKEIHVFESHNHNGSACVTVIAVVEGVDRAPRAGIDDDVREWTAYWMAHATVVAIEQRIRLTRDRGNKIDRLVAEAMFPRLSDWYFRE